MNSLQDFFRSVESSSKFSCDIGKTGGYVNLRNSGQRGSVKEFTISLESILSGLQDIKTNLDVFSRIENYEEKRWRDAGAKYFSDLALNSIITVQTKPCFTTFSKIINWANGNSRYDDSKIILSNESLDTTIAALKNLTVQFSPKTKNSTSAGIPSRGSTIPVSKPFLLLAGISGTGKSRFVRNQALKLDLLCSVAVRPDWHEPSDLLGYVSRLKGEPEYHSTDVLKFLVKAWINACDLSETTDEKLTNVKPEEMETYWLCLDEMNLAPVEQYFADYLSIIETRDWNDDEYTCAPLLKAETFSCIEPAVLKKFREELKIDSPQYDSMWSYFTKVGIPIPPNLIVAGTVNMDETTHGFSRKVIDRALTLDFDRFFPNNFDHYLEPMVRAKLLSFPTLSKITKEDLSVLTFDLGGTKTIRFCKELNQLLINSPFQLAFRALNELLISLVCTDPKNDNELQAVWDDFLMTKVLPRIEGDADKLSAVRSDETLLNQLKTFLSTSFNGIASERPDFFRERIDGADLKIACRSIDKIEWMQKRLEKNGFTAFWP